MTIKKAGHKEQVSGNSRKANDEITGNEKRRRAKGAKSKTLKQTEEPLESQSEKEIEDSYGMTQGYEMTEAERRAIFESPLAKQGLHPAYLLGLRPLPWAQQEQAVTNQILQQKLMERRNTWEELQKHGWPGQEIAVNPCIKTTFEPPRWPFAPERTVPGYVFEGAEFYKGPSSSSAVRPATKVSEYATTSKSLTTAKSLTSMLGWPINYLVSMCGAEKEE